VVTLIIENSRVEVKGASLKTTSALEKATSYLVGGYYHNRAYRARRWDGREHLMTFKRGKYTVPIGLLGIIKRKLAELGEEFEVKRRATLPPPRVEYAWNSKVQLRSYQLAAVETFCASPDPGRGILKMPIRSGKTKTAAGAIKRLKTTTLFIVPSQMLLYQTIASLNESLVDANIGMIGDSEWNVGDVTVATIQTLARLRGGTERQCKGNGVRDASGVRVKGQYTDQHAACGRKHCDGGHKYKAKTDPRYMPLLSQFGFVIFDEVHHLTGEAWHGVMVDCPARFRLGLSATVYFDDQKENERGVIWLRACCGDIKCDISTSDLIEQGYLMRQEVEVYPIKYPNRNDVKEWSQTLQNECIYNNEYRNKRIVLDTARKLQDGLNVLIVTNRLSQIAEISDILHKCRISHEVVTGSDPQDDREWKVASFKRGDVSVLVGTVFGEGIDIPEVECVINAEGGRDVKATIQRMRNMTPSEGKTRSVLVDYWDDTNAYFRKHSRIRHKTYESEPAFIVSKNW